ncbi:MAG: NAD-dependent epimerase/dehydratase family protein [Saprospiraceae bacterium]|nr:NAD-dependent epimerase/dehydratase family protein [Saprospiraceae bacterium]MBK7811387.1 NAD-dependent epimerase/dehydratase family protein [Saprospiraceae bacterium]
MNVLLTGATGFLGYRTLERLVELPYVHQVKASGRTLSKDRLVEHPKVKYLLGNLENEQWVNNLVKGVDLIINAAALSAPWGKRQDFINANLNTQLNLINAAKANSVSRFIYISSPSIYFEPKDKLGIKESDLLPSQFINEYARTKFEAEQMLIKKFNHYIILRPRALIGRGDHIILPRLIKAFDTGRLRIIGNGQNIVDLTSVSNVADAIIQSMTVGQLGLNQVYNISNGDPVFLWPQIAQILKALGKNLSDRRLSIWMASTVAFLLELKSEFTDYSEPTLTRYSVGTLAHSFTMDISKAKELLGYSPHQTIENSILEFVNWYKYEVNL